MAVMINILSLYHADASGEVDVADDGTHAAGGVAASECLAANLGGGGVAGGGTGARISANDNIPF